MQKQPYFSFIRAPLGAAQGRERKKMDKTGQEKEAEGGGGGGSVSVKDVLGSIVIYVFFFLMRFCQNLPFFHHKHTFSKTIQPILMKIYTLYATFMINKIIEFFYLSSLVFEKPGVLWREMSYSPFSMSTILNNLFKISKIPLLFYTS